MPEVACGLVIDISMSLARTDARQEIARRWNKSGNFFEVVTEEVGSTQGKCMRSLAAHILRHVSHRHTHKVCPN